MKLCMLINFASDARALKLIFDNVQRLCTRFSCLLLSTTTSMDAAEGTPASKKGKMENGDSYIPTQCDSNGDGTSNLSLIFSLLEQQGELVKSLGPFQVRNVWLVVVQVGGWLAEPFGCSVVAGHHSTMASLWLHVQCQAHCLYWISLSSFGCLLLHDDQYADSPCTPSERPQGRLW